jgi:aryl-alcohol dehydrogenase-like predicted oxidoreductase
MPLSLERRPEESEAIRVIHAALDEGITLVDTADVYCLDDDKDIGHNERLLQRALREWSGDAGAITVATKGGLERPGKAWSRNGRPEHLRRACERSLEALRVEVIDVYQIYAPDPVVPWAETVGELARLREEGKVRAVGLCHVSRTEIEQARAIVPIATVQNRMNPFDLTSWAGGIVQSCREWGITFLACAPVGGLRQQETVARSSVLCEVGLRYDATPFEVSLAWLLARSPNIVPIPGASRVESVRSSARATRLRLSREDLDTITTAVEIPTV